ncbi:hypothetical protein HAX54_024936, partial [Datura stramonium]|nr:hypothetical protein [Datura stramonium]
IVFYVYKLYLSDWVYTKIFESCKVVTGTIFSLQEDDDNPSPLLGEWVDLLQPSRIDWINLFDILK